MLVGLDALVDLEVIGLGVQASDEVEALGADDGVRGPAHIQVRMSFDGSEGCVLSVAQPQGVHGVRVAGAKAQAGEFGLSVEFVGYLVAFGYG